MQQQHYPSPVDVPTFSPNIPPIAFETPNMSANLEPVFLCKTIQIAPIRTLFTALKDIILGEINVSIDQDGIKIISMDKSQTILAQAVLYADRFEEYTCQKQRIVIGMNIMYFFKIINSIAMDDTLCILIEASDYNNGVVTNLTLKFENGKKNQCKITRFRLSEPEVVELTYPNVTFSSVLNMPSSDFQKIVRDLLLLSDKIEIKSVGDEVQFSCRGIFADTVICRSESKTDLQFITKQDSSKIIQGMFTLKSLALFIKCTSMCPQIELYLENDLPLVVKYYIASLGEFNLCLSPLPPMHSI